MKNWLELIPIYARVHKRGSRMTRTCIALAVFLMAALMKTAGPERLSCMPVWGVSLPGTCVGAALGVLTVLLSSRAPAKRAARVSPMEAVRTAGRVKKGYVLMSGAFALCIVLFLAFTTVADFLEHALLPPPWTPELSVVSSDNTCSIPHSAADAVLQMDGVKRVYGRMFVYNISMTAEKTAEAGRTPSGRKMANLISYEENQFSWAEESLAEGSVKDVSENPGQVLYVAPPEEAGAGGAAETGTEEGGGAAAETNGGEKAGKASAPQISVGDRLTLAIGGREQTVTVAGILSESPLARQEGTATLLVSERTFLELTGEEGYNILDIQFENGADRENVEAVKAYFTEGVTFEDSFDRMQAQKRLYRAMAILAWGFLAVIVGITVLHVANTIRMNAESGKRQYGILRAMGLDSGQLFGMLAAQALSYAAGGCLMGWLLGIPVQRVLFLSLITSFWQDAWSLPLLPLAGITGIVLAASLLAVVRPFRSLMRMSVVDVINRRQG